MTELVKNEQNRCRGIAGQIRQGIRDYFTTLALIKKAWDEEHWRVLGYHNWQGYVDGEFGAERLQLPAEYRQKAIVDLRLAGMSQRAIGAALGVPQSTVRDDLSGSTHQPEEIKGADGKTYAATRPSSPTGADAVASSADTQPGRSGEESGEVDGGTLSQSLPDERSTSPADHDPDAFTETLDRLVPDSNPHREWQRRFLDAISGVHKVMRFAAAEVADRADEQCVDELARVRHQFEDYFEAVISARILSTPDNVTPIRRIS
jgi:hypothetical protein